MSKERVTAVVGFFAIGGVWGTGAYQNRWRDWTPAEGGFVIALPGAPQVQQTDRKVAGHVVRENVAVVNKRWFGFARDEYAVLWADMPEAMIGDPTLNLEEATRAVVADFARRAAKGFVNAKVEKVSFPGGEAFETRCNVIGTVGTFTARAFWVGRRIYALGTVTQSSLTAPLSKDERRFFDSFRATSS